MAMQIIKNAVCVTGTYEKNGETKKQYTRVGKLFKYDDGGVCLKMDSVPVNFDGWINFYDLDDQKPAQPQVAPAPTGVADDDIPF